jgi:hypothetical protein
MAPLRYTAEGRLSMFVFYTARRWSAWNVRILRSSMGIGKSEAETKLAAHFLPFANQLHVYLTLWSSDVA